MSDIFKKALDALDALDALETRTEKKYYISGSIENEEGTSSISKFIKAECSKEATQIAIEEIKKLSNAGGHICYSVKEVEDDKENIICTGKYYDGI